MGTAIILQRMVFGNANAESGSGVFFTRDPSTGENKIFGEFLTEAQGEELVGGAKTPVDIHCIDLQDPKNFRALQKCRRALERYFRDIQEVEFTIESGTLYFLQTRNAKLSPKAALRILTEFVQDRLISREEAVLRTDPNTLESFLHPTLDPSVPKRSLARGLAASPGAASGRVALDPAQAEAWVREFGDPVILVRSETSPEDFQGLAVSQGVLTSRGGMTSHAAVIARGMGKVCITGCGALKIDLLTRSIQFGNTRIQEGEILTLDGSTGEVFEGEVPVLRPALDDSFKTILSWANHFRRVQVLANADTVADIEMALELGATGIGLCRTEPFFLEKSRTHAFREMILAESEEGRERALQKIHSAYRDDVKKLLVTLGGRPIAFRLLDPPLGQFLPKSIEGLQKLAEDLGQNFERIRRRVQLLQEHNPMLGHRGSRLGFTYPEIYEFQARATLEGALEALQEDRKLTVALQFMFPLLMHEGEYSTLSGRIMRIVAAFREVLTPALSRRLKVELGPMIELPVAALRSDKLTEHADFTSFGTTDLAQTLFGISQEDASIFLKDYLDARVLLQDPFLSITDPGMLEILKLSVARIRSHSKKIPISACGEQTNDPASIRIFADLGFTHLSCSPRKVPLVQLVAAQAALTRSRTT
jgi:pyruvate,orthophosphate dikinase